jgi:hypothetical protein
VDYSIFIMVMTVEMLEKVEITLAELPPPIFVDSGSVSVFLYFRRALLKEASGIHTYIWVFRSNKGRGRNNQANRSAEEEKRGRHVLPARSRPSALFWPSWPIS